MKYLLFFMVLLFSFEVKSQENLITDSLIKNAFSPFHYEETPLRSVMKVKKKNWFQTLNPIQYISTGLMFSYQRFISPQLQANCMYQTSCSEYTKLSVEELGLVKGVFLGFYQFQSCFSKVNYDYPEYKIDDNHKIINQIGLEK